MSFENLIPIFCEFFCTLLQSSRNGSATVFLIYKVAYYANLKARDILYFSNISKFIGILNYSRFRHKCDILVWFGLYLEIVFVNESIGGPLPTNLFYFSGLVVKVRGRFFLFLFILVFVFAALVVGCGRTAASAAHFTATPTPVFTCTSTVNVYRTEVGLMVHCF